MSQTLSLIIEGFANLFVWPTLGWLLLGVVLGIILGAIPGIGPVVGMALILPFTAGMEGIDVIIMFVMMYLGGMYGSSIAAILINAPGTAAAAATTMDGYPMSQNGKSINALTISAISSSLGGLLTAGALLVIGPLMLTLVLLLGSPEYFLVAFIGIAMITIVAKGALVKGIIVGCFGLSITTIGLGGHILSPRYTFGQPALNDGIDFVAVLIGLFALAEMIRLSDKVGGISDGETGLSGSRKEGLKSVLDNPLDVIKSGYLGMIVGSVPGAGASVSNFVAYSEGKRTDKNPESFGTGNPRGVVTAEAANTGTTAGSIVPTFAFGIPGSATTAVLLGALIMHGLQPGPNLFTSNIDVTYTVFTSLILGNIVIALIGVLFVTKMGYLTEIDTHIIIPLVVALAILGSFAIRNLWIDVIVVLLFGLMGYYMKMYNYSLIALVLGVVLGPIAEQNLFRSLQLSGGSLSIFVSSPVSLLLTIMLILLLISPVIKSMYTRN
ncbi:tripartite tricarboxylate transporter permease [Halorubraceae archaeon YAN]|nr:tripartite tricarboxylate transporter permease [Halorubraceae archaeon YAN]